MATSAVDRPPRSLIARLTLIPPPPGSTCGAVQRSLSPGTTSGAEVERSTVGIEGDGQDGRHGGAAVPLAVSPRTMGRLAPKRQP
jgi:hypothetical protein